jgi:hypothetical protein
MNPPTPGERQEQLLIPATQPDYAVLDIIRTESVLSRLPIHNLAKKGRVDIKISKIAPSGEVDLQWEVSYNERYGQARQLAYKLDTLVINKRIDETGRPLPNILRIGTFNEICAELGLATDQGKNTKNIKQAFLQNVGALINAKFKYKANDGTERTLEAGFTRYSVVFTGERLPDGRKADAVYIVLNNPFWEVINNAPVRPLDRAYMKELTPAEQRFYEILSYKFYAVIKHKLPFAKVSYSEYCTLSTQTRSDDWEFVRSQMYQVHRPHLQSGYLLKPITHEKTVDDQGNPDWIFYYSPGPRAHAEFALYNPGHRIPKIVQQALNTPKPAPPAPPPPPQVDETLIAELGKRGIGDSEARRYLAQLKPDQPVMDQLEYADSIINHPRSQIRNPQGFILTTLIENRSVPSNFETSARRKAREEEELRKREEQMQQQILRAEYDEYQQGEVERYTASLPDWEKQISSRVSQLKRQARCKSYTPDILREVAARELQSEMASRVPGILSFEAYCEQQKCAS